MTLTINTSFKTFAVYLKQNLGVMYSKPIMSYFSLFDFLAQNKSHPVFKRTRRLGRWTALCMSRVAKRGDIHPSRNTDQPPRTPLSLARSWTS